MITYSQIPCLILQLEKKKIWRNILTHTKKTKTTSEKCFAVLVTAFSSSYVCDEVIIKIIVDRCGKTYDEVFVNVIVGIKNGSALFHVKRFARIESD